MQGFGGKARSKKNHYEDLDVGDRIIIEWISREIAWNGRRWVCLA
jgi:hypothetical protein